MYLLLVLLFAVFSFSVLKKYRNYQNRSGSGVIIFILIFSLSACYTSAYTKFHQPPAALCQADCQILTATIKEPPLEKEKSIKLVVEINQFVLGDSIKFCSTKAMLYVAKNKQSKNLVYGDRINCYAKLAVLDNPKNPHEFDYQNYLARKGIHLCGYVNANAWKKTGKQGGYFVFRIANQIRNKFLKIFDAANMDINELGIISAVLLGSDDKLDPNLVQSYTSTGVNHVLCVSGMHVGIVYMLLAFFLIS
jgi:competence protein ComEC